MARINLAQMLGMSTLLAGEDVEGDFSANVIPPARSPLGTVTTEKTLALPAAYAAVQIIGGLGWMLSLEAVRGSTVILPTPPLIEQPDPWRSRESFLERTFVGLGTDGNAFWLRHFHQSGELAGLEVLDPNCVRVHWKKVGGRWVKTFDVWTRDGMVNYGTDRIVHIWGLEVPGHDRGLGPIAACRAAIQGIINVREYADGWFSDRATDVPSGVLTSEQYLDPDEATEYKKRWLNPTDATGKSIVNGPSVRVLGKGLTYSPILLKPEDAQWLESQGMGVLDVARMFGMPADYLLAALEGSSLTYTTLLMVDTTFMRRTGIPRYLRKVEVALSAELKRGQKARFKVSDYLQPDIKTQAEVDEIYLRNDVISAQEVRDRDGIAGPAPKPAQQKTEAPA